MRWFELWVSGTTLTSRIATGVNTPLTGRRQSALLFARPGFVEWHQTGDCVLPVGNGSEYWPFAELLLAIEVAPIPGFVSHTAVRLTGWWQLVAIRRDNRTTVPCR